MAREAGALVQLRLALNFLGEAWFSPGSWRRGAPVRRGSLVAEATGNRPVTYSELLLAVWRGQEAKATELLEATRRARRAHGMGRFISATTYLEAVLCNSLADTTWHAMPRGGYSRAITWGSDRRRAGVGRGSVSDR